MTDRSSPKKGVKMKSNIKIVKTPYGKEIDFDAATMIMDDDIRELVHHKLAPCSDQEFFDAYCVAHEKKYGEEFEPAKQGGNW